MLMLTPMVMGMEMLIMMPLRALVMIIRSMVIKGVVCGDRAYGIEGERCVLYTLLMASRTQIL
eukprot:4172496-Pyramimonas_sp.AAC.1